jgi:hypothetical protein
MCCSRTGLLTASGGEDHKTGTLLPHDPYTKQVPPCPARLPLRCADHAVLHRAALCGAVLRSAMPCPAVPLCVALFRGKRHGHQLGRSPVAAAALIPDLPDFILQPREVRSLPLDRGWGDGAALERPGHGDCRYIKEPFAAVVACSP